MAHSASSRTTVDLRNQWIVVVFYLFLGGLVLTLPHHAPISDEAAYAKTAKIMAEEHRVELSKVTEPIALAPIVGGALTARLTGFSLTAMRIIVVATSLGAALGFYWLLIRLGFDMVSVLLGTFVLMVHPTVVVQSALFMTEMPFVCFMVLGVLFTWRGLAERSDAWLALGAASNVLACMTRQPGILLPISIAVYLLWSRNRVRMRQWLILIGVPVVMDLVGLAWFYAHGGGSGHRIANAPAIELYLEVMLYLAIYAGLLCLPLMIGAAGTLLRHRTPPASQFLLSFMVWLAVLFGGLLLISWKAGEFIPFSNNILAPVGDNHLGLVGEVYKYVLKQELPYDLPPMLLKLLFLASLVSAAAMLAVFSPALRTALRLLDIVSVRIVFVAAILTLVGAAALIVAGPQVAIQTARRVYDLKPHLRTFEEQLPRILQFYRSAVVQLLLTAGALLTLAGALKISRRESRPVASTVNDRDDRRLGLGLLYAACSGQAFFYIVVAPLTQPFVFRRYLLMFAPGVIVLALNALKDVRLRAWPAAATMGLLAVYGWMQTDAMNRLAAAKWQGATELMRNGVDSSEIGAGLTFTNWYRNAPLTADYDSRYLVVTSPVPGYRQLKQIPVPTLLAARDLTVYQLERTSDASGPIREEH